MSDTVFPKLRSLAWPVPRRALWKTLVNQAESGREVRVGLWSAPLYEWDLAYNGLSDPDRATLWGFYNARGGSLDSFLFSDQTDNFAPAAALGSGDGNNQIFQFVRSQGGYLAACNDIQQAPSAPKIYLDGVLQTTGYSIAYLNSGILTFSTPPGAGVAVSADFYYYYRAKFKDDTLELQNILFGATTGKLTLAMVRS